MGSDTIYLPGILNAASAYGERAESERDFGLLGVTHPTMPVQPVWGLGSGLQGAMCRNAKPPARLATQVHLTA